MTNSDFPEDDPTLTSGSLAESGADSVDLDRADLVAERVLSEPEPLPFRTRFPLGGTIGSGGMAEVYMARDRVLNRIVAVKVMHSTGEDESKLRRFLREAQITAQLSHPNVVPVHAMENNGLGRPAFVMKCVQGMTFKEYIDTCRRVHLTPSHDPDLHGIPARLDHLFKVCDAVAFAHSKGVVHLDLKPANVMIGAFGEVYVMDWGIAKVVGEEPGSSDGDSSEGESVVDTSGLVTGAGGMLGTPIYMPPEQVVDRAAKAGPASDQFALGMILYELLTLHLPRRLTDLDELMETIRSGERLPFGVEPGEPILPQALQAVTDRATSPDPADRYPSVEAMAADLRHWQRNEELDAWPDNLLRRSWRSIQRHPVRAMAAVLVVLLGAASIAILSLMHALGASARHQQQTEILSGLVSEVSAYVHTKDQRAKGLETLVESLAVEVEASLRGLPRNDVVFPAPTDLMGDTAPPDTAMHSRYRQRVSYASPVLVWAPTHDRETGAEQLRRLGVLTETFQSLFLRALTGGDSATHPADLVGYLRERSRMGYAYVGLRSGILISYPGNAIFPSDYDPRQRPWYRNAPEGIRLAWGDPYPDASGSGYLVPCNRRIRGPSGELVGVVGIDIPLDTIIEVLRIPDLPHQRRTLLLDQKALVVALETDIGRSQRVGTQGDKQKERVALGIPGLENKIRSGTQNGIHRDGDSLFVFSRLNSLGWYVVVELDAEPTLAGR